jgi:hypothetical protein
MIYGLLTAMIGVFSFVLALMAATDGDTFMALVLFGGSFLLMRHASDHIDEGTGHD